MASLPDDAIARVNDVVIDRETYASALTRYAAGGSRPLTDDDKAALVQNLIDDELLLQRGIELGMPQSDAAVRTAIISSLVASITAEADAANPADDELENHLAGFPERFSYTTRVALEAWQTDDESIAQQFAELLRNTDEMPKLAGISPIAELPAQLIPIEALRDHVGPGIAAAAASMPAGSSAVFARRGRWLVVRVDQIESTAVTELDSIRNRVLLDYRRELADQTLRRYLDELRERADIAVELP